MNSSFKTSGDLLFTKYGLSKSITVINNSPFTPVYVIRYLADSETNGEAAFRLLGNTSPRDHKHSGHIFKINQCDIQAIIREFKESTADEKTIRVNVKLIYLGFDNKQVESAGLIESVATKI